MMRQVNRSHSDYTEDHLKQRLQYGFLGFIKTVCRFQVSWLALLHVWLYRMSRDARTFLLVALGLFFPVFELHYLLFKLAYSICQRRLLLLGDKDGAVCFDRLYVHLRDVSCNVVEVNFWNELSKLSGSHFVLHNQAACGVQLMHRSFEPTRSSILSRTWLHPGTGRRPRAFEALPARRNTNESHGA
jgi:hypothetical protein